MTLIAYANKTLYADDIHIIQGTSEVEIVQRINKITISKCKRFAFGLAGPAPFPDELERIELKARDTLIKYFTIKKANELIAAPCPRGEEPIILMARDVTFVSQGGTTLMKRLDERQPFGIGAGDDMFMFGYQLIEGPITQAKIGKLFEDISDINNLVGPLVTTVSVRQLKPFIFE